MILETSTITTYFSELGLDAESAQVYLALHTHGRLTMSELASMTGIERTRLYRIAAKLKTVHLVTQEKSGGHTALAAAPIANLHILLNKKEQEVKGLQDKLWVIERLLANTTLNSPATTVKFYQGGEALREMFWNETKTSTQNLAILYENMQLRTEKKFFEQWVRHANERRVSFRGIICDNFIKTQQQWYKTRSNERLARWEPRYISPEIFKVTHSTIIYENVVAYYVWKDAEIFGVEITNQQIADAQRAFFEMLWVQAQPVNDITGIKKEQVF